MQTPENPNLQSFEFFPGRAVTGPIIISHVPSYGIDAERMADTADRLHALGEIARSESDITSTELKVDSLTGKPNRRALVEQLENLTETQPGKVGVIFVDLDGLKATNDTLGHKAGDALICKGMEVLDAHIRTDREQPDTTGRGAFRLSGDEQVAIIPDVQDSDQMELITQRLQDAYEQNGVPASVGFSLHHPGQPVGKLIDEADKEMYEVKKQRRLTQQEASRNALDPEVRQIGEEVVSKLGHVGLDADRFHKLWGTPGR